MLSPSGSGASDNLQRSKSASSVKERRKHPLTAKSVDPETARVHALIAAHRAVDRSRERAPTGLRRSQSATNRPAFTNRQDCSLNTSPASYLRTQRCTLQTRVPKLGNALKSPGAYALDTSRDDSMSGVEFGIEGENYGAEPSSYRKLRRARSSLTPVRRAIQPRSEPSETPFSQARTLRPTASSITLRSPGLKLRLKRSMNFLRPARCLTARVITAPAQLQSGVSTNKDAIALARDQFTRELDQPLVTANSSFSLSSRARKAQSAFRKTFRATSKAGESGSDSNLNESEGLVKSEQGHIPASLTSRIKKIFGASKPVSQLPPQQLDATKAHFKIEMHEKSPEAGFDRYLAFGPGSDGQKSPYNNSDLRPSTVDDMEQLSQRLSRSDSRDCLTSTTGSRVTSWTNSTAAGSISVRPLTDEPKRLSVIKEDGGPYQPSSSAGRHIGGIPIFQRPLRIPEGQVVDSQRVYSALMKRIDEEQKEMEQTQAALKEIHTAQEQDDVVGHYLFSSPTIRRVESRNSASQAKVEEKHLTANDTAFPQAGNVMRSKSEFDPRCNGVDEQTAQDQSVHSGFYSVPSENIVKTAGNYQRLCNEGVRGTVDSARREADFQDITVDQAHSNTSLSLSKFSDSTESIYSRTTNGGTNADYISPVCSTENFGPRPAFTGSASSMATVLHYAHPRPGVLGLAVGSINSSVGTHEYQNQGSEASAQSSAAQFRSAPQRPLTHFRENAQIDCDDTEVGNGIFLDKNNTAVDIATQALETLSSSESFLGRSADLASDRSQRELLTIFSQIREVPRYFTPTPNRSESVEESQSALLSQSIASNKVSTVSVAPSSAKRKVSGLRKISVNSVAKMLQSRKSRPTLEYNLPGLGKENDPNGALSLPPISTPSRYQVPDVYGDDAGQLRKLHENSLRSEQGQGDFNHCTQVDDSPSERLKSSLSARLSRPFNMDVPERNRPFDSTYLGQHESSSNNRLSVALNHVNVRQRKRYGNIGLSLFPPEISNTWMDGAEPEPTALPVPADISHALGPTLGRSSRQQGTRLVSNFLRSRRKRDDMETRSVRGTSPAFI